MKTIVTHLVPDLDAISSVWLLKRFLPGWESAEVRFVPAGKTLNNDIVDSDPDIIHVDTGMGMLDHHQTSENTCAAKRTLDYILRDQKSGGKILKKTEVEALERMVEVINDVDHFKDAYYPRAEADFYDFSLTGMLDGWKLFYGDDSLKLLDLGMTALDGVYKKFQDKIWAEREIDEKGVPFESYWGKAIGVETINDETLKVAQKKGYVLVVRKDPHKDYVRIKGLPDSSVDLTRVYEKLMRKDREATWFLHVGKKMLLNGSSKNPETRATKLTLREIIEALKKS